MIRMHILKDFFSPYLTEEYEIRWSIFTTDLQLLKDVPV